MKHLKFDNGGKRLERKQGYKRRMRRRQRNKHCNSLTFVKRKGEEATLTAMYVLMLLRPQEAGLRDQARDPVHARP